MGTGIAYSLISLVSDLLEDCHMFMSTYKRHNNNSSMTIDNEFIENSKVNKKNEKENENNIEEVEQKNKIEKKEISQKKHEKMNHLEEKSLVGVFDWWRKWRTGVHIPITNQHGEIVWCCTSRQSNETSDSDDEDEEDDVVDDDANKHEQKDDDINLKNKALYDLLSLEEDHEDEDVISMLGLSSGDVVEIQKPTPSGVGSSPTASAFFPNSSSKKYIIIHFKSVSSRALQWFALGITFFISIAVHCSIIFIQCDLSSNIIIFYASSST
jgi:hypothetical protein